MTNLCTVVTTPEGKQVQCKVIEWPLYDPFSLLPKMAVRGKALNAVGVAIVPMTNLFSTPKAPEPIR